MSDLTQKTCKACEGGVAALSAAHAQALLAQTPGWTLDAGAHEIVRDFKFKNHYETIAFVNAIAWVSHREDHHPDLEVHYNTLRIRYTTHAVNGLSENDFICAAKINALVRGA